MGFFKKHQGRASYELFTNYAHYLPGMGGMAMLFFLFIIISYYVIKIYRGGEGEMPR